MGKVICPGELLIDFICTDKDVSMVDSINFLKKPGGAPANAAVAIKKMGVESCFLGCVGNDPFGVFLENTLKKYGVNCDMLVKMNEFSTTLAFVSLKGDGERDFYFSRGADVEFSMGNVRQDMISDANVFHFGSATAFLGGRLTEAYYGLLDYAVENNKIILFDPNYRDLLYKSQIDEFTKNCLNFIRYTDVLKVSEEEAYIITGADDVYEAAEMLCKAGAKFVIVTVGSKGAIFSDGKQSHLIASKPVKMVDATGAGDAFIGTVAAEIAKKYVESSEITAEDLKRIIERANIVGAMTVQKYGALESIPTAKEVEDYINN